MGRAETSATMAGYDKCHAWLEGKLGERLPGDMWEWAHDGTKLCKLANILKPGSVDMKLLNKRSGPMFFMQNIDFATEGFKKILPAKMKNRVFRSPDLYEKTAQYPKAMWICFEALMRGDGGDPLKGAPKPARSAASKTFGGTYQQSDSAQAARIEQVRHGQKDSLSPPLARDVEKVKAGYNARPEASGASGGTNTTGDYADVKAWVSSKLGEPLSDDLWEWAHDGRRLCKLANALCAGAVDMSRLNKRSGPMFDMQNIDFATDGFKKMLPARFQARLFRSPDLYERKSQYPKGMWICLDALKKLDEQGKIPKRL